MRHFLGAVAALLGLCVSSASAYYLEVTIDLNQLEKKGSGDQRRGGAAGNAGVGGQQQLGIGGFGGNRGGSGLPNMAGLAGMAGVAGGERGGMAGLAGGRGGMAGLAGLAGSGSGKGMAGLTGFSGMRGNVGFSGYQGNPEGTEKETPPALITVRFELKSPPVVREGLQKGKYIYQIEHKWGHATIVESDLIKVTSIKIDKVSVKYNKLSKTAHKDKSDKTALLALAKWSLRHGLVKELPKIMDEVGKIAPRDPAVVAYKQVDAAIKARPGTDDPAASWLKTKAMGINDVKNHPSAHYTLLSDSADKSEIDLYLERLEDSYKTFFYWFALQGRVLQVPKHKLIAILMTRRDEFNRYHDIFKTTPLEAAGFTARRDNVPVMYAKRLDPLYVQLDKENTKTWGGKNPRPVLLKGTKRMPESFTRADDEALTLFQTVMEEETQLATVSHAAIRQLLSVAGLPQEGDSSAMTPILARNLAGPEWVRFGMASFFETPEGAYWPGAAVANWKQYVQFMFLLEDKKLENPTDVLEKVITDQYFRDAMVAKTDKERDASLQMARATSWALVYYLASGDDRDAQQRTGKGLTYLRLLSKLPRDMELSKAAMKKAFAEAFGLPDRNAETLFANNWFAAIRKLPVEVPGFIEAAKKARNAAKAKDEDLPPAVGPLGPNRPGPNAPNLPNFPNRPREGGRP
jgi:hypothetical protein